VKDKNKPEISIEKRQTLKINCAGYVSESLRTTMLCQSLSKTYRNRALLITSFWCGLLTVFYIYPLENVIETPSQAGKFCIIIDILYYYYCYCYCYYIFGESIIFR